MEIFHELASHYEKGGWGMHPILVCFIFTLAILIDRLSALYGRHNTDKEAFLSGLKKHIFAGDLEQAISYTASQKPTPLTAIVKAGLMQVEKGDAEVQAAMDEASLREMPRIEARTGYLAMLGNVATLCGLLGTVSGLIRCFEAVYSVSADKKSDVLSQGIAEAMNCTAFGLATGIIALVFFSLLQGRTQHMLDDINETSVGVLNLIVANRDKISTKARA
jgi:biopolymer transport protein ExbB/TolQ